MCVLITGGDGFIGKYLCDWLSKKNIFFDCWKDDVFQLTDFNEKYEVVVHLAAVSSPAQFHNSPLDGFKTNVIGTQVVLNYCRRVGAGIVFSSTCGVYSRPLGKAALSENAPIAPADAYSMSKYLAEELCFIESKRAHIPYAVLRLFNVYGKGQREPFIIPYIINNLIADKPVFLKTPNNKRDFVHVLDISRGIAQAIEFVQSGGKGIFNIGTGMAPSILEVAQCCEKILGKNGMVNFENAKTEEPGDVVAADLLMAKENLNWTPRISLTEGLRLMASDEDINCLQK